MLLLYLPQYLLSFISFSNLFGILISTLFISKGYEDSSVNVGRDLALDCITIDVALFKQLLPNIFKFDGSLTISIPVFLNALSLMCSILSVNLFISCSNDVHIFLKLSQYSNAPLPIVVILLVSKRMWVNGVSQKAPSGIVFKFGQSFICNKFIMVFLKQFFPIDSIYLGSLNILSSLFILYPLYPWQFSKALSPIVFKVSGNTKFQSLSQSLNAHSFIELNLLGYTTSCNFEQPLNA